ncbi:hypothetical protein REPUB_Repub14bG0007800 [Reevesia pubescens]
MMQELIPLAVKIFYGAKFPLAPFTLGNLYYHLDLLVDDEAIRANKYVLHSNVHILFLQILLWEHYPIYASEAAFVAKVEKKFQVRFGKVMSFLGCMYLAVCS